MTIEQLKEEYKELKAAKEYVQTKITKILSGEIVDEHKAMRSLVRKQRIINNKDKQMEAVLKQIEELTIIQIKKELEAK